MYLHIDQRCCFSYFITWNFCFFHICSGSRIVKIIKSASFVFTLVAPLIDTVEMLSQMTNLKIIIKTNLTHENMPLTLPMYSQMDDTKEDYSHLPPTQQKKKLNEKLDKLRQVIAKETAER